MSRRTSIVILFLFFCGSAVAQQVTVHSRFMADSLKIGERVGMAVTARYPSNINVLFPDSTFQFAPFEFEEKKYFPTVTKDSLSYDSAIYYLASFEIDSVQMLSIPVYMLAEGDCTEVFGSRDTIYLKHLVDQVPASIEAKQLPLKTNTSYFNVQWLFNYPVYIALGIFLFGCSLACYFIFGKHVRRYFIVRRLTRNHTRFVGTFDKAYQPLQEKFSPSHAESALLIWKKYMETLDNKPYTRSTSREIAKMEQNEKLTQALRVIDRGVYGGYGSEVYLTFSELKAYSEAHYSKKLEEVQNG